MFFYREFARTYVRSILVLEEIELGIKSTASSTLTEICRITRVSEICYLSLSNKRDLVHNMTFLKRARQNMYLQK